jgi:hypothetical protein
VEALALERTLTELDHARLSSLMRSDPRRAGAVPQRAAIEAVLDGCAIVPSQQVPPDVVTMYSQVELRDPQRPQPVAHAVLPGRRGAGGGPGVGAIAGGGQPAGAEPGQRRALVHAGRAAA